MADKPKNLTEADHMSAYVLGHIRAIETVLMLMWNDHPRREQLKADASHWLEAIRALDLNQQISDEELGIRRSAHEKALDAIFAELLPATPNESGRKA
jgi:hypothetical protein